MSLDAIFFDVDDTLFSTSEFAEKARLASCTAMRAVGLRLEIAEIMEELREVVAEWTSNYDHHFDQLLRRIPKRHYKGVNPAVILASAVIAYHDTKQRELSPWPDAIRLLEDLSKLEPPIVRGIISNGLTIKQAEKLLRLGVYPYLTPTAIYISEQIGINKPNVKLYRRACSDLNLRPARCVYVGDHPTRDIDPANALGMITVRLRRGGRHDGPGGATAARHEVRDYDELRAILIGEYGLPLTPGGTPRPAAPQADAPSTTARARANDDPEASADCLVEDDDEAVPAV